MEEEDCPRSRKVVSRSPAKTVRLLNLRGIWDSPVECESTLERDFVYRIALCPGVVRLKHQPFRMKLVAGKIYTPDFFASHRDGSASVIEVKPKEMVAAYLKDVLNKPLESTFVVIEEVPTDNWGSGGLPALEFRRRRSNERWIRGSGRNRGFQTAVSGAFGLGASEKARSHLGASR